MSIRATALGFATVLAAAPLAAAASSTNAYPADLNHHLRMIGNQKVDLTPLLNWYKAKEAHQRAFDVERPLAAWKRVRLEQVQQMSHFSWTVEADVEGTTETIVLENPPAQELAAFTRLKFQHAQLMAQTNQLQRELRRVTAARKQADYAGRALAVGFSKWGAAANAQRQADALASQEIVLGQTLEGTRARLRQIESTGYNFAKPFALEIFALDTGRRLRGQPIFDRGRVF